MNSPQEATNQLVANLEAVTRPALQVNDRPDLLANALGQLLARHDDQQYGSPSLDSPDLEWMLDAYVATRLAPLIPGLVRLHTHLVRSGATPEDPFDFEHCDRYGVAFAHDGWKSMALMTQNYTYMVVLVPSRRITRIDTTPPAVESRDDYALHLRMCTGTRHSRDFARPKFPSLAFLASEEAVYPRIGYGPKANDYFAYKDGRDRGYLCSMEPRLLDEGFDVKDVLSNYVYLPGVVHDLHSHISCLPSET